MDFRRLPLLTTANRAGMPRPILLPWRVAVPESTIILAIQKTPVKFDVSAGGIPALHAAGITGPHVWFYSSRPRFELWEASPPFAKMDWLDLQSIFV